MRIKLQPSAMQQTLEQRNPVNPDILAICQLHADQKEAHQKLVKINQRIDSIRSRALPDQDCYREIVLLTREYTKCRSTYKLTNANFWQHAMQYWIDHKKERKNLLNALCPVSIEPRIQFQEDLKAKLLIIQPQSCNAIFQAPKLKLPSIQEEHVESIAEENEAPIAPPPLKKQKSFSP
jgi:hypothetical protein